jgi:ferric-dicitrate binding protein FerR (iron transport regulator)
MTEKINWEYLIEKFTKNTCTKEEFGQLLKWVEQDPNNEELTEELRKHWENAENESKSSSIDWEKKFSTLLDEASPEAPVIPLYNNQRKIRLMKWAAVASVILLISVSGYFGFYSENNAPVEIPKTTGRHMSSNKDVAPGGNKAILTLADGSVIDLDSAQNGTLTTQGNIKIIKGEDGQLLYYVDQESSPVMGYNTISTPRGGKYEVVLSDGTKVWLNAASSLKFPASFTGKTRDVALTGEGYFEVAHLTSKEGQGRVPFNVSVTSSIGDGKGITVEVLGTHFNVNAYKDENSVATTLLEGSVKVKKGASVNSESRSVLLKPGEQANLTSDDNFKVNRHANTEEVIAWKNDNFEFNNTAVTDIMRQISRWYDVDVEYRGSIPEHKLTGKISRNVNLSKLIDMLHYTGVNMKIENKKIIIWEN